MLEFVLAVSTHMLPGDWNEIHPGLRYERGHVMAAAYRNSEGDLSAALGGVWRDGPWFIEGGLVTGYSAAPVVPMLRAGAEAGNIRLFVAPAANTDGKFGVVIGLETIIARF